MLITGATLGIGDATIRAFGREGARVAFNVRRAGLSQDVAASINADAATRAAGLQGGCAT